MKISSRILSLISYFSLLLSLILNTIWLSPPESIPIALILILFVTPLLFPLMGILAGKTYTYIWASYLALFYFAHAIGKFTVAEQVMAASLQLFFSLAMFISFLFYVRTQHKIKNSLNAE